MVMIDQATRDAFGQLLVVHYLRARGARVIIANQATWIGSWERYRPDVVYISWIGGMMKDILKLRHKPEIALMDQEGGRLGEVAFKRSFFRANDAKEQVAVCLLLLGGLDRMQHATHHAAARFDESLVLQRERPQRASPGGLQVRRHLLVDGEHRRRRAELGAHVRDRRLAGGADRARARADVFHDRVGAAGDRELAGDVEDHVLRRRPAAQLASEVDRDVPQLALLEWRYKRYSA